jgi:hypothetical protein
MTLPADLALDGLTPSKLWAALDDETRDQAAQSLYRGNWDDPAGRQEADAAIAAAIRFRPMAVRKLPVDKRVGYLRRTVRPDDALASSLLLALHLDRRSALLESFLDRLGIPQEGGMIDPDHDVEPVAADALRDAVAHVRAEFDAAQVEVYLASLVAMEPEVWGGLVGVLNEKPTG